MSDAILFLGKQDEKLPQFLTKLGYGVFQQASETALPDLIAQTNLDIVVVDGREMAHGTELCNFLRTQESTKGLPIVYLAGDQAPQMWEDLSGIDKLQVLKGPVTIGTLAGRIATELRLRKFAGKDELKATLAEMNSTLRDLNERFKRELDEAKNIQRGLLPSALPSDSRFQLAVSYEPLDEVGGDWYFASKTKDEKVSLQIADVTGHGLGAAFVGSMTKLAMAAVGKDQPAELLTGLNRLMAPQIPSGRFVTMCSVLYDPETGDIQFARAGHPPAIIIRAATGESIQLKGDGFAVGFFEDSEYEIVNSSLGIGDVLFLYTDGISEAQNRSMKTYGLERLATALVQSAAKGGCAEILNGVLDDVDLFREERIINDDITAICLKRIK